MYFDYNIFFNHLITFGILKRMDMKYQRCCIFLALTLMPYKKE